MSITIVHFIVFPPLQKNSSHVWYSMSLVSEPKATGDIIRDPVIKMDFKCFYPHIRNVSLSTSVSHFTR